MLYTSLGQGLCIRCLNSLAFILICEECDSLWVNVESLLKLKFEVFESCRRSEFESGPAYTLAI